MSRNGIVNGSLFRVKDHHKTSVSESNGQNQFYSNENEPTIGIKSVCLWFVINML